MVTWEESCRELTMFRLAVYIVDFHARSFESREQPFTIYHDQKRKREREARRVKNFQANCRPFFGIRSQARDVSSIIDRNDRR